MAFDDELAQRVRNTLQGRAGVVEKKMFGGLAFMLHGHMCVGILDRALMARVGPEQYSQALKKSHVREMDFTGRPMKGYVFVEPKGLKTERELEYWITACATFVDSLPPKPSEPSKPLGPSQ